MGLTALCRSAMFVASLAAVPALAQTPAPPATIWSLLDEILEQAPDKAALQSLLGADPVQSDEQYGLKYLWPQSIGFSDGVQAANISLIKARAAPQGDIHIEVSGRCVNIREIEAHYPGAWLSAMPPHGYPDAAVTYKAESHGRKVSFFINYYSRCLVGAAMRSY